MTGCLTRLLPRIQQLSPTFFPGHTSPLPQQTHHLTVSQKKKFPFFLKFSFFWNFISNQKRNKDSRKTEPKNSATSQLKNKVPITTQFLSCLAKCLVHPSINTQRCNFQERQILFSLFHSNQIQKRLWSRYISSLLCGSPHCN